MTIKPEPNDIRLRWAIGGSKPPLSQMDGWSNRRIQIAPDSLTVNYWLPPNATEPRWYVSVEGRIRRLSDGAPGRGRRTISFWPDHDYEQHRIESAPEWVKELVAAAHEKMAGMFL